ncbi:Fur family transcriptional regulator [Planctomycetota bacterium]
MLKSKLSEQQLDKISSFRSKCREKGLKITPQRMAVYGILVKSKEHPSVERVYRQVRMELPNISFDTVNRTLLTLVDIGSASVVEGSGDAKRFDGELKEHQHFRCVKCGRIIDFHHKPFDDIKVPKAISKKFKILNKTVYFEGICDLCMAKGDL